MRFVTLTSDWNNDDFYIAAVKGALYTNCKDVNVVDITHKIDTFRYTQAAFILRNTFLNFPTNTIHIVAINTAFGNDKKPLCIKVKNHYFFGMESDIFSLLFVEEPEKVVVLKQQNKQQYSTFMEHSFFVQAAISLINGAKMEELGEEINYKHRYLEFLPAFEENIIYGKVIYIDSYKNVFTNITKEIFEKVAKNRPAVISIKREGYTISEISKNYNDVEIGDFLALFNSLDLMELAQRNGKMAEILTIDLGSPVNIKFQ